MGANWKAPTAATAEAITVVAAVVTDTEGPGTATAFVEAKAPTVPVLFSDSCQSIVAALHRRSY